jgi:hypothetical protein
VFEDVVGEFLFIELLILFEVVDRPVEIIDLVCFRDLELIIQSAGNKVTRQCKVVLRLVIVVGDRF